MNDLRLNFPSSDEWFIPRTCVNLYAQTLKILKTSCKHQLLPRVCTNTPVFCLSWGWGSKAVKRLFTSKLGKSCWVSDPSCWVLALLLRRSQHWALGRLPSPKPERAAPTTFSSSSCDSVLLGRDSGVWFALCLHLCLLQESSSSQNLAALREEGSLGCVLQR